MILNLLNLYSLIFALFDKIDQMTEDLVQYRNISCSGTTEDLNPSDYVFNYTSKRDSLDSYNLIFDVDYGLPNENFSLSENITTAMSDLIEINSTAFNINNTDYAENASLGNIINILSRENVLNVSFLNETIGNFSDYNITDLKDMFLDFLTYSLTGFNTSNTTDSNVISTTETNSLNGDDESYSISAKDVFETLKSFLMLSTNISSEHDEEIINRSLTTMYNEIHTTAFSLKNDSTPGRYPLCETAPAVSSTTSTTPFPITEVKITGNYSVCAKLRTLCWETMFGQELIKLTVMDLIMTILSTLAIDFFRGIFVRIMNRCWCWDLEKTFPQYGDFKVAENILHLVNNQGMVWMGMFFSPGLVALNVIKLYIMMYFRAWAVLTCNVPHEVIFRASRSNNFYYALLLMMLFLCVLPVGFAVVWIKPSWHCGPFSNYQRIFHILTMTIRNAVPKQFHKALDYIASPGIVIPLLVLLILIIYYLISLTGALREANEDLKIQLRRERTEERRKMFQIVDRRRGGSGESNELSNTPFTKWKKLLGNLPSGKSFDETPKQQSEDLPQILIEEKLENKNKDFLTKFIKKALGKSSTSEDEQNVEDGTDTEQHDSLPYDTMVSKQIHKPVKPSLSWGNSDFSNVVSRAVKTNQRKLSNLPYDSIDSVDIKPLPLQRRDTFEIKRKISEKVLPSTSTAARQDSVTSVWSENIPVITISKTDSAENILVDTHTSSNIENSKFKPKIKCALKKQSTEFDEDTICHFNKDLEKNLKDKKFIKSVSEENFEPVVNTDSTENVAALITSKIESNSDQSSSEDTEFKESSVDTILNFPKNGGDLLSSEEKTISDDSIDRYS